MIEEAVGAPTFAEFMEYVATRDPRLHRWAVRFHDPLQAAFEESLSRNDANLAAYSLPNLLRALSRAAGPRFRLLSNLRPFSRPCCSKRPFIYPFCDRGC